jgi:hypothetical protein
MPFYARQGWRTLEQRDYRGYTMTVMALALTGLSHAGLDAAQTHPSKD